MRWRTCESTAGFLRFGLAVVGRRGSNQQGKETENGPDCIMPIVHSHRPCLDLRSDNPCIMDYIQLKHSVAELEKHASDWKRKIDLLQMEKQRTRQVLKGVASMAAPGGSLSAMASQASFGRSMSRAMSTKSRS